MFEKAKEKSLIAGGNMLIGAGSGVLSAVLAGVVGVLVMRASNTNYDILKTSEVGAIGGALLGGTAGLFKQSANSLFSESRHGKSLLSSVTVKHCLNSNLAGLIGFGILLSATGQIPMNIEEMAIAFAIGSAISTAIIGMAEYLGIRFTCELLAVLGDGASEYGESRSLGESDSNYHTFNN
jgi:hypothetical protein